MPRTIAGQYPERRLAEQAMGDLQAAGFRSERMSIIETEPEHLGPPPKQAIARFTGGSLIGVLGGAVAGAIVGAIVAALVPGAGQWTLWAVIVCAIAGACIGWLMVGLGASGVPFEEAEYRRERMEQGSVLLTVDAGGHEAEARDIMRRHGARNILITDEPGTDGYRDERPDLSQSAPT